MASPTPFKKQDTSLADLAGMYRLVFRMVCNIRRYCLIELPTRSISGDAQVMKL
jgi:hypothetical protein